MKKKSSKPTYKELVLSIHETEQTLSELRKKIIDPNLFYSQVDMLSNRIHNLSKFYLAQTKLLKEYEYEPK